MTLPHNRKMQKNIIFFRCQNFVKRFNFASTPWKIIITQPPPTHPPPLSSTLPPPTYLPIYVCTYMCGVMWTTQQSRWTFPEVLQPFSGNFQIMHLGCTMSKACLLVFRYYIINECCDVTYDVMLPHLHQSHDLLL